jgi:hypothetical protein
MKRLKNTFAASSAIIGVICMAAISDKPKVSADDEQPEMVDEVLAEERTPREFDADRPLSSEIGFDLSWHRIAGGGETYSTGGAFQLGGTIGQHEAGVMSGGDYALSGGFWSGGDAEPIPPCALADLNCDGVVNVSDLLILLGEWGDCPGDSECPADLNGDGVVNVSDLLILLGNWG